MNHTRTPKDASYSLRLPSETLESLREIEHRVGIPVAEQIRRALALWLAAQKKEKK